MNLKKRAQLYPKNLPNKLGFDRIKEKLEEKCQSQLGKVEVEKMAIYSDFTTLNTLQKQVAEYVEILTDEDYDIPDTAFSPLKAHIEKLKIDGSVLPEDELLEIRLFLKQYAENIKVYKKFREHIPSLYELSNLYPYEKEILASIDAVFDAEGEIRPEVSTELNRIRTEIKKTIAVQDKRFMAVLRKCREQNWLSDEEQTIRNGRRVLALFSEHKRKLKGIIHDESATGKSTFLEPQSLVEFGNDLFDLRQKERKEIYRILLQLCYEIRPFVDYLGQYQILAGKFDFIKAKAKMAISLNAVLPKINNKGNVYLQNAEHPLLKITFSEQGRSVVPLNLEMDQKLKVLVVSGPNAGGKSICLKTVGLVQLMFQAGMAIPAGEYSTLPIFSKLFLDMGDDQSLENDLSTYSSHLKALKHFVNFSDKGTLFLLDEFGTGTDPQFGGTIAEGVLEHLVNNQSYGVATTHYSNLKLYAEKKQGVSNASMMFDQENMKPTYVLEIGRPGSSYAFEIAKRIGLNNSVLEYANKKLGNKADSFEILINKLEKEKISLQKQLKTAADKENRYKQLLEEYKAMKQEFKEKKQKMALDYKTQLQNELKNANKKFEKTLAQLKTSKKSQEEIAKEIRAKIKKDSARVDDEVKNLKEKLVYSKKKKEDLVEGDSVKLLEGTETGIIQSIEGKYAIVAFNHLRTKIPLKELEKAAKQKEKRVSKGVNVSDFILEFKNSVDLRGLRADEALREVEQLIDQAVILNQKSVSIVHGRGDGILKIKIKEFLKSNPDVTSFDHEHADRGGDGVTIVKI